MVHLVWNAGKEVVQDILHKLQSAMVCLEALHERSLELSRMQDYFHFLKVNMILV
jgi:hypothetical protein